jgi:hypothetical protein
MLKEADRDVCDVGEGPILYPDAAAIFLVMSGRAIEAGGCLVAIDVKPDVIGKAAFGIYERDEEGSLAEVIEEMTGYPSDVHPALLTRMVAPAIIEHARRLGMPAAEAAQIAV